MDEAKYLADCTTIGKGARAMAAALTGDDGKGPEVSTGVACLKTAAVFFGFNRISDDVSSTIVSTAEKIADKVADKIK